LAEKINKKDVAPPDGLVYRPDFISLQEESSLVKYIQKLTLNNFIFQGFTAKRRIASFGFKYDFTTNSLSETAPIPDFLLPFRDKAAEFALMDPLDLKTALITEYPPGAPIGWHRDLHMFETIIGISLLSSCTMKFKPYKKEGDVYSIELEPRSIYIMRGVSRWQYQHSIPPLKALRYSITFRSLRSKAGDVTEGQHPD